MSISLCGLSPPLNFGEFYAFIIIGAGYLDIDLIGVFSFFGGDSIGLCKD
jgi:hypothetical protein